MQVMPQNAVYAAGAHFGQTPATRQVRFGADPTGNASPKQQKPGFLETIRQAVSQQGLIRGVKEFAGTFGSLLAWNKALDAADSQSTFLSRFLAVFDIASARFRENLLSKSEEEPAGPDIVNYTLYQNVLATFPKLVLADPKDLPLDLTEQAVAASADPDGLKQRLQDLRDAYQDVSQVSLDELKDRVKTALESAEPQGSS